MPVGRAGGAWQPLPSSLLDDSALIAAVNALHRDVYRTCFAGEPGVNGRLGIDLRAFRRLEQWRLMLVLTPWMLARLMFPDRDPGIPVPGDWAASARQDADYQVLGPRVGMTLLGQDQPAHLNYSRGLGHYLLQPIVLDMAPYGGADDVFAAWGEVIRTREENMERHRRHCPIQQELSRREFFGRNRG